MLVVIHATGDQRRKSVKNAENDNIMSIKLTYSIKDSLFQSKHAHLRSQITLAGWL